MKRVFLFLCLSLMTVTAMATNITARVDRDPVRLNESFKIIFEADDNINADPDFAPLEQDFDILSRSRSSNMQILNSEITQQTRWTLFVMAKRSGELNIPSIEIGSDHSPQISITVNAAGDSGAAAENMDMFLEVEAQPTSAYVQSQILYTIRFYRAVNLNSATMPEPTFSGGEVRVQQLGEDSSFETRRNGRRYVVIERNYALFPQQSGAITINPITLDAQVVNSRAGVFDPFGQNTSTRRLNSKRVKLDIKPIPTAMQNQPWLPAEDLRLSESWSQQSPEFVVGEPITRTLTLKADGLSAAQLPALPMPQGDGFKTYPDQPRLNDKRGSQGINGTRQEKIAIIPTRPGELTLPAIEIPWWNVNRQQREVATLPARTVQVQPGVGGAQATSSITQPDTNTVTAETRAAPAGTTDQATPGIYLWLSLFFAAAWLTTSLAWVVSRRRTALLRGRPTTPGAKHCLGAVKKACERNDPHGTKRALLEWGAAFWPAAPPASLGDIGRRLDEDVQGEIESLNQTLYGSRQTGWRGDGLWQSLKKASANHAKRDRSDNQVLLPLYP